MATVIPSLSTIRGMTPGEWHLERCVLQRKAYNVDLIQAIAAYWEREVKTGTKTVEKDLISRTRYDAMMIRKGQGFHRESPKLIVLMIYPNNSCLPSYETSCLHTRSRI